MADIEKVISTFEKIISNCKEDGCDFVDLSFEDAEQILSLLKEQEVKERISDAIHETAKQFRQTIVRCKDCKHYTGGINGYCERWFRKTGGNEFFCADGERKERNG